MAIPNCKEGWGNGLSVCSGENRNFCSFRTAVSLGQTDRVHIPGTFPAVFGKSKICSSLSLFFPPNPHTLSPGSWYYRQISIQHSNNIGKKKRRVKGNKVSKREKSNEVYAKRKNRHSPSYSHEHLKMLSETKVTSIALHRKILLCFDWTKYKPDLSFFSKRVFDWFFSVMIPGCCD